LLKSFKRNIIEFGLETAKRADFGLKTFKLRYEKLSILRFRIDFGALSPARQDPEIILNIISENTDFESNILFSKNQTIRDFLV
jgi:hypothetical protein